MRVLPSSGLNTLLTHSAEKSGVVTGILRLVYFFQVDMFADVTWYSVSTMTWTLAEPGVYLIAATLPSLRPLVRHVFKTLYSSLLDCWSCAFSTRKLLEGSTTAIVLNPAIGGKTTITVSGGVRFAESAKIHDPDAQSKRIPDGEISWVAGSAKDMHTET